MFQSSRPANGVEIASWLLAACALVAILPLRLLAPLFAGLLVFQLVGALSPLLARAISNRYAKLAAVGLLSVIVIAFLSAAGVALIHVLRREVGSLAGLYVKLAALLDDVRTVLPPWLLQYLPANSDALAEAANKWLREHAHEVQGAGAAFGRGAVKILIGMIVGAMLALYETDPGVVAGRLSHALEERVHRFAESFRRVVFAQIWISSINTFFTALFLVVVLPLAGVKLPLTKTLIAITFFAGLLPVIGNLISNTAITFVALSVSMPIAIAALGFLIVIHKLEYFLNARIVGGHINARAWELLIAMLVMEAAFGIPGLVAAPVYYAYLKDELAARGLV